MTSLYRLQFKLIPAFWLVLLLFIFISTGAIDAADFIAVLLITAIAISAWLLFKTKPSLARWLHIVALVIPLALIFIFGTPPYGFVENYLSCWNEDSYQCIIDSPDFVYRFSSVSGNSFTFDYPYSLFVILYAGIGPILLVNALFNARMSNTTKS